MFKVHDHVWEPRFGCLIWPLSVFVFLLPLYVLVKMSANNTVENFGVNVMLYAAVGAPGGPIISTTHTWRLTYQRS